MKEFNSRVQMMDAGMTLFSSPENFGTVMGIVREKMERHGKVLKPAELSAAKLPDSTGECDLFLDWSTWWRVRYISCHIESAGETDRKEVHRYAATFKEGNRNTRFRGAVMIFFLLCCLAAIFSGQGLLCTLAGLLLAFMVAYIWILPSGKARRVVTALMQELKDMH